MSSGKTAVALDQDSLHILPLSTVPLITPGLAQARLIKNGRLESVVELFSDEQTGSGQIYPNELRQVFQFDETNAKDLDVVQQLSQLSSYDVYSLRIELRRLGIEVDEHKALRLSEAKSLELSSYMRDFIRPLIATVYGKESHQVESFQDIVKLFTDPNFEAARSNLITLSEKLNVDLLAIPEFLQDYGDTYLSLAYYQHCLDQNRPSLQNFLGSLADINAEATSRSDMSLRRSCAQLDKTFRTVVVNVDKIMSSFRVCTTDMWDDLSGPSFEKTKVMINGYQTKIGGALCALSVKMKAWQGRFPGRNSGTLTRRVEFLNTEMRHGIEQIETISFVK